MFFFITALIWYLKFISLIEEILTFSVLAFLRVLSSIIAMPMPSLIIESAELYESVLR
jgi:hypothetical protein